MIKKVDNCVGCRTIFGSCMGTLCPNHARLALVCDICGGEEEKLYKVDGQEICEECLLEHFETIDQDDIPYEDDRDYEPDYDRD